MHASRARDMSARSDTFKHAPVRMLAIVRKVVDGACVKAKVVSLWEAVCQCLVTARLPAWEHDC